MLRRVVVPVRAEQLVLLLLDSTWASWLPCGCHELFEGHSVSSASEPRWWRERAHLSPERTWQVATVPAPGSRARGLGSESSQRDWAVVDGTTGPTLMWSQEMPDAARCLPTVLSSPGSRRAPPVWDRGQGRSLTQCSWSNSKGEAPWMSEWKGVF